MLKSNASRVVAVSLIGMLALELELSGKISGVIHLALTPNAVTTSGGVTKSQDGPLLPVHRPEAVQAAQGDPATSGMTF